MKDAVAIEPSGYALVGQHGDPLISEELSAFYRSFQRMRDFIVLNELRVICSLEIFKRAQELFPYAALASDKRTQNGFPQHVATLLQRFLDEMVSPWAQWAGLEDTVTRVEPCVEPPPPLYSDASLLIAWHDLLAQVTNGDTVPPVALVGPPRSFAPETATQISITRSGGTVRHAPALQVHRHIISERYLDVDAYRSLRDRSPNPAPDPDIDYEDSGHQPPERIKQALERTADRCRAVVLRMNTTRISRASQPCKLTVPASDSGGRERWDQLEYAISDRTVTFRGYFTTRAATAAEQSVALALVRRVYVEQCERAGYDCGQ